MVLNKSPTQELRPWLIWEFANTWGLKIGTLPGSIFARRASQIMMEFQGFTTLVKPEPPTLHSKLYYLQTPQERICVLLSFCCSPWLRFSRKLLPQRRMQQLERWSNQQQKSYKPSEPGQEQPSLPNHA